MSNPRLLAIARLLRKHRARTTRKVDAIRGDLAEAERAPEYRRQAEALLAYLHKVPKRAHVVVIPDPAREGESIEIALDPALNPQANAARLFKRAAKGERGAVEIRARLAAAEAELAALGDLIERAKLLDEPDLEHEERAGIERDLDLAAKKLPPALKSELADAAPRTPGSGAGSRPAPARVRDGGPAPGRVDRSAPGHLGGARGAAPHFHGRLAPGEPGSPDARGHLLGNVPEQPGESVPGRARENFASAPAAGAEPAPIHRPNPPRAKRLEVPARLQPRRLVTTEDQWPVLIGRSNEGNDHLTLHLARPEDYWFHVHGAAGSHVVLRRGKGKNEPSRRTLEEVAAWAAFYSQARTAGKVPVIWTLKKYVRKPRGAKPGSVVCEREKSIMARPKEPAKSNLAGEESEE